MATICDDLYRLRTYNGEREYNHFAVLGEAEASDLIRRFARHGRVTVDDLEAHLVMLGDMSVREHRLTFREVA